MAANMPIECTSEDIQSTEGLHHRDCIGLQKTCRNEAQALALLRPQFIHNVWVQRSSGRHIYFLGGSPCTIVRDFSSVPALRCSESA